MDHGNITSLILLSLQSEWEMGLFFFSKKILLVVAASQRDISEVSVKNMFVNKLFLSLFLDKASKWRDLDILEFLKQLIQFFM